MSSEIKRYTVELTAEQHRNLPKALKALLSEIPVIPSEPVVAAAATPSSAPQATAKDPSLIAMLEGALGASPGLEFVIRARAPSAVDVASASTAVAMTAEAKAPALVALPAPAEVPAVSVPDALADASIIEAPQVAPAAESLVEKPVPEAPQAVVAGAAAALELPAAMPVSEVVNATVAAEELAQMPEASVEYPAAQPPITEATPVTTPAPKAPAKNGAKLPLPQQAIVSPAKAAGKGSPGAKAPPAPVAEPKSETTAPAPNTVPGVSKATPEENVARFARNLIDGMSSKNIMTLEAMLRVGDGATREEVVTVLGRAIDWRSINVVFRKRYEDFAREQGLEEKEAFRWTELKNSIKERLFIYPWLRVVIADSITELTGRSIEHGPVRAILNPKGSGVTLTPQHNADLPTMRTARMSVIMEKLEKDPTFQSVLKEATPKASSPSKPAEVLQAAKPAPVTKPVTMPAPAVASRPSTLAHAKAASQPLIADSNPGVQSVSPALKSTSEQLQKKSYLLVPKAAPVGRSAASSKPVEYAYTGIGIKYSEKDASTLTLAEATEFDPFSRFQHEPPEHTSRSRFQMEEPTHSEDVASDGEPFLVFHQRDH